jgi:HK97 family phage prohead protease
MAKQFKEFKLSTTDEVEGKVEAVFSVFNEVDSDGDVVLPNSIKSGYGDKGVAMVWAHDWKDVVGRGEIVDDGNKAIFKGQFIMDTERGRDAFNTVKAMGDLQQWSFGYEVDDYEVGMFQKDTQEIEVRYLKNVKVWEVSPVLVGANQNTSTLSVKSDEDMRDDCVKDTEIEEIKEPKRFNEDVDELLIKLSTVLKRAKELTALRLKKEKLLSDSSTDVLEELQDTLQEVFQDIDTLLDIASPKPDKDIVDDTTILLQTEELLLETMELEVEGEI